MLIVEVALWAAGADLCWLPGPRRVFAWLCEICSLATVTVVFHRDANHAACAGGMIKCHPNPLTHTCFCSPSLRTNLDHTQPEETRDMFLNSRTTAPPTGFYHEVSEKDGARYIFSQLYWNNLTNVCLKKHSQSFIFFPLFFFHYKTRHFTILRSEFSVIATVLFYGFRSGLCNLLIIMLIIKLFLFSFVVHIILKHPYRIFIYFHI